MGEVGGDVLAVLDPALLTLGVVAVSSQNVEEAGGTDRVARELGAVLEEGNGCPLATEIETILGVEDWEGFRADLAIY